MRRIVGKRYVWVTGLEICRRGLKLTHVMQRPEHGCNTDCYAYDIRRVRRAIRNANG